VLAAIDLDNQPRVVTHEINNVAPERDLPTEPVRINLARPDQTPDGPLGIGHLPPQGAGPVVGAGRRVLLHDGRCRIGKITPTLPSPIKGEGS
jgi:hypothetical protein